MSTCIHNQLSIAKASIFGVGAMVVLTAACLFMLSATPAHAFLSGTLYSDAGSTAAPAGVTLGIAISTSTDSIYSVTTSGGGAWSLTGVATSSIATSTPIVIWLDASTTDATTLVMGVTGATVSAIPVYYNTIVTYAATTTGRVDLSRSWRYDSTDDADILFVQSSTSTTFYTDVINERGTLRSTSTEMVVSGSFTNDDTFDANGGVMAMRSYITNYLAGRDGAGSSTGAVDIDVNAMVLSGSIMYVAKNGSTTACAQAIGSSVGCELQVFNVSDPANPTLVAGRDANGSPTGASATAINSLAVNGNYLYAGKSGNAIACAQATPAAGCELVIFDISSTTNPVYVGGRDVSGNSTGTDSVTINELLVRNNVLYVLKNGNATDCASTVGAGTGCELMVFNLASATDPVYVAGRDATGAATGTASLNSNSFTATGTTLYVVRSNNNTACDQTAGNGLGCELMLYDISSTTNPIYVAGRDASGSSGGATGVAMTGVLTHRSTLYVSKNGNNTTCSQAAGSAQGCELMVFNISSTTDPVYVAGRDNGGAADGATNTNVLHMAVASTSLLLAKAGSATTCSQAAGSAQGCEVLIFDIASTTNPVFGAGRDSTFALNGGSGAENVNFVLPTSGLVYVGKNGSTTTCSIQVGNAQGCEFLVFRQQGNISGTTTGASSFSSLQTAGTVSFLSSASTTRFTNTGAVTLPTHFSVSETLANAGIINSGAGEVVLSGGNQTIVSSSTITFHQLAKTVTTPSTLTVEAGTTLVTTGHLILSGSDTNNRLSLYSTATGTQFSLAPQGLTTLEYLRVRDVNNVSATVTCSAGCVDEGNNINWMFTVGPGELLLSEHAAGQAENEFSLNNKTNTTLFAFQLTAVGELVTVSEIVLSLAGVSGVDVSEVNGLRLYHDVNGDGTLDGGDLQVLGSGAISLSGETGTLTLGSGTTSVGTTSKNYIITGNTTSIDNNDYVTIRLYSEGITATGDTSQLPVAVSGAVSSVQHIRSSAGGSAGSRAPIGDDAPQGAGQQSGGTQEGGEDAGQQADGENIASDPDFFRPSTNGSPHNEWTNGSNAYASDGVNATAGSAGFRQTYGGFGFNIPGGNSIQGIVVKIDGSGSTAAGTIEVGLSWNGGSSITSVKATPVLSGSDLVYEVGGLTDLWGRAWTASELSDTNFRVRVIAQPSSNTVRLDALQVRVYHIASGGGGGGGGEI